jgi:signal peptidase I
MSMQYSDPESFALGEQLLHRPNRSRRGSVSYFQVIWQAAAFTALAILSYWMISHFVLQTVQVVGPSMSPTLHNSDHYFLNRWLYHVHPPKRSDIVVVKDPTDGTFVVKRIIATPGDSVLFSHGRVIVNGRELDEPYLTPGMHTFTDSSSDGELITCGKDQYFVLGDNRNNSCDSRMFGPILRQNILGAIVR